MAALVKYYSADGFTQITAENFPDIFAGATDTALKFAIENFSNRVLNNIIASILTDGSDGFSEVRIKLDASGTISRPYNITAAVAANAGVWGAIGTYGYVVTALNASGETIASLEITANITVVTQQVTIGWTSLLAAGATSYKVYRTATVGTYGATTLRASVAGGASTSYVDNGGATGAGTPPSANTTGGAGPAYGTPPAGIDTSLGPITIGTTQIGQQVFFWLKRVVSISTPETGNPRGASVHPEET